MRGQAQKGVRLREYLSEQDSLHGGTKSGAVSVEHDEWCPAVRVGIALADVGLCFAESSMFVPGIARIGKRLAELHDEFTCDDIADVP